MTDLMYVKTNDNKEEQQQQKNNSASFKTVQDLSQLTALC